MGKRDVLSFVRIRAGALVDDAATGQAAHPPADCRPECRRLGQRRLGRPVRGERRKTGWLRAEAAGDPGPWRQQAILGRTHWDAEALRDVVGDDVVETLASPDAVLVIDETGFLKQGKASCGVGRHYTGSAGKITNCQIGGFAAYVSDQGHAFMDRRLCLPKASAADHRFANKIKSDH